MARRRSVADSAPDLAVLLPSWELHLRAERKSPETVKAYGDGVRRFLTWCADTGTAPVLDRATVAGFVHHLLEAGNEPATARSRHLSPRPFSGREPSLDGDYPTTGRSRWRRCRRIAGLSTSPCNSLISSRHSSTHGA